jgi:hypothetical protein
MITSLEQEASAADLCANCGAVVSVLFCGHCGQKRGAARLSLRKIVADYLADALTLQRGLPLSLVLLLIRPGALTADYLAGRRTRYVSPLKLYMLVSVVTFAFYVFTRPLNKAFYGFHGGSDWNVLSNAFAYGFLLCVPVFAGVLRLLYRHTGRPLVEHLVFTLHSGTVALLLGFGFLLLDTLVKVTWGNVRQAPFDPDVFFLVVPVLLVGYMFASLRRVYGESWRRTAGKGAILFVTFLVMLAGVILVALEATKRFGTPVDYVEQRVEQTG